MNLNEITNFEQMQAYTKSKGGYRFLKADERAVYQQVKKNILDKQTPQEKEFTEKVTKKKESTSRDIIFNKLWTDHTDGNCRSAIIAASHRKDEPLETVLKDLRRHQHITAFPAAAQDVERLLNQL